VSHHNTEQKKNASDKVAEFIGNNRTILWVALAVLVVAIVAFAVIDSSIQKKRDHNSNMIVELQDDFQNWISASEENKESLEETFLEKSGNIIENEESGVHLDKALFLRARFYLQKEEWASASTDFIRIAESTPDSYLASVSLYNGASALENEGKADEAIALLTRISNNYRAVSPLLPEALFNLARLKEQSGKEEEAVTVYEDLAESYPSSSWTNLAKTRIISLKASGVSQ